MAADEEDQWRASAMHVLKTQERHEQNIIALAKEAQEIRQWIARQQVINAVAIFAVSALVSLLIHYLQG